MAATHVPKRASYVDEPADHLPFGSPSKARRYATERYVGATGRNWYTCDPSLQFLLSYHMQPEELAWARPHLERVGALMGGPVSEWAEATDRDPPRLVKYDRWGHDISEVVLPESLVRARREVLEQGFSSRDFQQLARAAGVRLLPLTTAASYLLCQADIGLSCALGTGGGMIASLVDQFAPPEVRDRLMPRIQAGELRGGTAQLFTERTGGSDLAEMETTAEPDGDAYRLNGLKWFASNADGEAYIVMAKPIGAADNLRGAASFLVLKERRDGGRNGIRIRQLKDKLGTKSVASAEVEFVDAEAFLLSGDSPGEAGAAGDGRGASRLMEMTNGARMGVAMMGLGCARRSLVESICYAGAREAFRGRLVDHPLVKRKLAEMMVEVEAVQAMVFDRSLPNHQRKSKEIEQLRLAPAVVKLRAARLGITMAGDAMEIFGGNGYVETWPIARILRDAHVNSIWEGADNILCLDVRRAIEREEADVPFMERIEEAIDNAGESSPATRFVADRAEDLRRALRAWKDLERTTAEARLFPLSQFMGEVYAGALLVEQAEWEQRQSGSDRKALVARLFAERHLAAPDPLRGMASRDESVDRFDDLLAGAFLDETAPL